MEKERINNELAKIILFPGTREQYEEFKGYKVRIIDIGRRDKGVFFASVNEDHLRCRMENNIKKV